MTHHCSYIRETPEPKHLHFVMQHRNEERKGEDGGWVGELRENM